MGLAYHCASLGAMASHLKWDLQTTTADSIISDLRKDFHSLCDVNLAGESLGMGGGQQVQRLKGCSCVQLTLYSWPDPWTTEPKRTSVHRLMPASLRGRESNSSSASIVILPGADRYPPLWSLGLLFCHTKMFTPAQELIYRSDKKWVSKFLCHTHKCLCKETCDGKVVHWRRRVVLGQCRHVLRGCEGLALPLEAPLPHLSLC